RRLRQQRRDWAGTRQRQQATVKVQQGLRVADITVEQVQSSLHDFLRARFSLPSGEITPQAAAECLRQAGVDASVAKHCEELLETCAAMLFAPGVIEIMPAELAGRAEQLMQEITAAGKAAPTA